jgi:hypothetical protein
MHDGGWCAVSDVDGRQLPDSVSRLSNSRDPAMYDDCRDRSLSDHF